VSEESTAAVLPPFIGFKQSRVTVSAARQRPFVELKIDRGSVDSIEQLRVPG
jgi:hypothetical protein